MLIKDKQTLAWILLITISLIWGSSFILIKKALIAFDAEHVGSLRIISAAIFLTPFALKRFSNVRSKHLPFLISVGLTGSLIPAYLFAIAQTRIDSSIAGVLNAITPLWVLIIGAVFFLQRFTLRTTMGMIIGFLGTMMLILGGVGAVSVNLYGLFIVAATICYGTNLNIIKYKLSTLNAVTITSISLVIVGPLAALHLFTMTDFTDRLQSHPYGYKSLSAVVLLGVMGTAIALVLFNKLVQITTPVFASTVTYLIPITAVAWGMVDGETLVVPQFLGMALILVGVFIAHRKK